MFRKVGFRSNSTPKRVFSNIIVHVNLTLTIFFFFFFFFCKSFHSIQQTKNMPESTSLYDLSDEVSKLISFRDHTIKNGISRGWKNLSHSEILSLPSSPLGFTATESEQYQRHGGPYVSEIKNISQQEAARKFRRWSIERSLIQKGSIRKKYQDLSKSMDGKYNNLGSAPYIELSAASKLPSGWEEFRNEDELGKTFEIQLISAKCSIPEATAVIDRKILSESSTIDSALKSGEEISNESTELHIPISSDSIESKATQKEIDLRLQLKRRLEQRQREKDAIRKQKETMADKLTVESFEDDHDDDDLYQPEHTPFFPNPTSTNEPSKVPTSSFPIYSDQNPNAPEYNQPQGSFLDSSHNSSALDYDEIDACYETEKPTTFLDRNDNIRSSQESNESISQGARLAPPMPPPASPSPPPPPPPPGLPPRQAYPISYSHHSGSIQNKSVMNSAATPYEDFHHTSTNSSSPQGQQQSNSIYPVQLAYDSFPPTSHQDTNQYTRISPHGPVYYPNSNNRNYPRNGNKRMKNHNLYGQPSYGDNNY